MTKWKMAAFGAAAVSLIAVALPVGALAQTTKTHEKDVVFDSQHPCTQENVVGETRIRMTVEETDNGDGTTTVHVTQRTHGQQLEGVISQDQYTFNNAQDVHTTETILGSSGTIRTKTHYIHNGEDLANAETLGLDDFHQKLDVVINPLLPPVVLRDTGECK